MGDARTRLIGEDVGLEAELRRATRAMNETRQATRDLDEELRRATEAERRAGAEAGKSAGQFDGLKRVANGMGFGGLAGDLEDMVSGFAALNPGVLAGTAAMISFGGAIAATAGVAGAIVEWTASIRELREETEHLAGIASFRDAPDELSESADRASAAIEGLGQQLSQAKEILVTGWAPTVESAATSALTFGNIVLNIQSTLSDYSNGLISTSEALHRLNTAADGAEDQARRTIEANLAHAESEERKKEALELSKEALDRSNFGLREQERRNREAATAARELAAATSAVTAIEFQLNDARLSSGADLLSEEEQLVLARDRELNQISLTIQRLEELGEKGADVEIALMLANEAKNAAIARNERDVHDLRMQHLQDLEDRQREIDQAQFDREVAQLAADADAAAQRGRQMLEEQALRRQQAAEAVAMAQDVTSNVVNLGEERVRRLEEQLQRVSITERAAVQDQLRNAKQVAGVMVGLHKAAAIAGVAVNTAEAITKAFAMFGPPPSVAGIAAAAAAGTIGGIQAATIAGTKTNFQGGGIVGGQLASDQHVTVGEAGEGYLTRNGVRNAGGPQGVADLNAGAGGRAPIVVQNVYGHRIFDSFISDNLAGGGPLASRFDQPLPRGYTRTYRPHLGAL
jgi:hypothetical protein